MKGKGKGKGKQAPQGGKGIDDIMNKFGDEQMDAGFNQFEKNFNPEKDFDMPIYNNIDSQFDSFGKMMGGGEDDLDLNKMQESNKETEDDKLLKAILGEAGAGPKKKKNNDFEELSQALKMADANLKKKNSDKSDVELLKGIFSNTGNKPKKNNDMDELSQALKMADANLKKKNSDKSDAEILKGIFSQAGNKPRKNNDMDELSQALKMADNNLKKKNNEQSDAELLKGILSGSGNNNPKKKDDGMDELNNILSMADKNLKNKDKDDMALVRKYLTKEEVNEVSSEENPESKKEIKKEENKIEDKYPLQQEKIFHRINQMKCLSVLEKEIDICKMVIAYKKKNNLDSKEWESKIEQANKQLNDIKTKVESGEIDLEAYKKTVKDELNYEQKLLDVYLAKDQTSTQMQKDNIKKRINIRILVINNELKESNNNEGDKTNEEKEEKPQENTIKEEPPKKEEKNKPEPQDENDPDVKKAKYVDLLLQQYLSARNYFKENDLKENEKDCILKCKTIITAKRDIQLGYIDSIDLNELPKPITPEYIFGITLEEREEKFKEIIAELVKQKEEIAEKKKDYNDKLSKLKKRDFEKLKDQAKQVLDSYQAKMDKFDTDIEDMKNKLKDKWTPVPDFCNLPEEEKVEKINKDIPEYTMRIHFGKTDYDKDSVFLKVKLDLGEKQMNKEVKLKSDKNFDETFDWTFDKREYKSLHRKFIEITMERSYWYKLGGSDVKGSVKVDLKNLKDSILLEGNYKIELQSKRANPGIEVKIELRSPFVDKVYETITKDVFQIKKIYPPFNPKSAEIPGGPTIVPKEKKAKNEIKEEPKQEPKQEPKTEPKEEPKEEEEQKKEQKEEKAPEPKPEEKKEQKANTSNTVDRSMFPEEELADIDGVDYLNSLKVLEFKLKTLEDQIAKISGRTPKEMLQRKVKLSYKIKLMKTEMDNGNVSPKDYFSLLSEQMIHDRKLFALFKQEKDLKNAKIIAERIKLMMAEMTELKDVIKNNK